MVDRSRDNPRVTTQNLDMLFMIKDIGHITIQDALKATELRGIGLHGLMDRDMKVLETIGQYGPIGKNILVDILDFVDISNYELIERYLLNKGYIISTSRGRILTDKGKKILLNFNV